MDWKEIRNWVGFVVGILSAFGIFTLVLSHFAPKPILEYRCILVGTDNVIENTSYFQYNNVLFNLLNIGNKPANEVGFEIIFSPPFRISIENISIATNSNCEIISPPQDVISNYIIIKCSSLDPFPSSYIAITTPLQQIDSISYWSDEIKYTTIIPSCNIFSKEENRTIQIKGYDIKSAYIK